MSLTFSDDTVKKPNAVTPLPSSVKRPVFGTLYGFDASGEIVDGALKTESNDFLITESGNNIALDV